MHDRHLRGELRQESRLLHCRVASTDDHDLLLAKERTIADGAVRNASALETNLGVEPDLACGCARRDDDGACAHDVGANLQLVGLRHRIIRETHLSNVLGTHHSTETLGLRAHLLHQLRAHNAVLETRKVVDIGGDHQLAASGVALDYNGREGATRGVECSRVAGRSATDDCELMNSVVCHAESSA